MADKDAKKCEHNICSCATTDDSDYCGTYCETAGNSKVLELACNCGHPGCATEL